MATAPSRGRGNLRKPSESTEIAPGRLVPWVSSEASQKTSEHDRTLTKRIVDRMRGRSWPAQHHRPAEANNNRES
jgi:hypothetical protein